MNPVATHDEIAELLGAYALHAVSPDEAAAIEAHLESCATCHAEVTDHRQVAALLGDSGGDAPDGLWDRIASSLEESPPPLRLAVTDGVRRSSVRASRVLAAALGTAAAVVIGVLGVRVVQQGDQLDRVEAALGDDAMLLAANAALVDPDAARSRLTSPDGSFEAAAVVLPDGTGYLMAGDLPDLDASRSYQLWGQVGDGMISLGLLGADPEGVVPFMVSGDVAALAITDEVAAGVAQPSTAPLVIGRLA